MFWYNNTKMLSKLFFLTWRCCKFFEGAANPPSKDCSLRLLLRGNESLEITGCTRSYSGSQNKASSVGHRLVLALQPETIWFWCANSVNLCKFSKDHYWLGFSFVIKFIIGVHYERKMNSQSIKTAQERWTEVEWVGEGSDKKQWFCIW